MTEEIVYIPAANGTNNQTNQTAHDEAVDNLSEQLGDIGKCSELQIFKCNVGSKNADSFCSAYPSDKFTIASLYETVKSQWGAGDYRVLMYKSGHRGVFQNKLISIAADLKLPTTPNIPDLKGELGQAFNGFAQVMMQAQQQQAQILQQLLNKPAADPQAQMMQQFALMKGLREAMGITGAPVQPLNAVAADPFAALGSMMTGLAGLVAAVKTIAPDLGINFGGEDDSILSLAKTVLPQLTGLVANHQKIEAAKVSTEGALVARRYAVNPQKRPHQLSNTQQNEAKPLPPRVNKTPFILPPDAFKVLNQYAEQGADVDEVAKTAIQFIDEKTKAIINRPDAFKCFVKAHNEILDNPDWWLDLLYALQELIEGDTVSVESTQTDSQPDEQPTTV
jgi:hypothetical protein